jgi:hypothetical protein
MDEKGGEHSGRETKPTEQFVQKLRDDHTPLGVFFFDMG